MFPQSPRALLLLLVLLMPARVAPQGDFSLTDALDEEEKPTSTVKPKAPAGSTGGALSFDDFLGTTTRAPVVTPKAPQVTRQPAKPKTKPAGGDLDLADALDTSLDSKDKSSGRGGGFSDNDLVDVSKDSSYKPDKGRAGGNERIDQSDDTGETTAEVGTIAGIVSAVAMALVGAVSSYISYQKKKFCFSIQQSLNAEVNKSENPDGVVATEPQAQTLLEQPSAEQPAAGNTV